MTDSRVEAVEPPGGALVAPVHPPTSSVISRLAHEHGHGHDHDHGHGDGGHHHHAISADASRGPLWAALILLVVFTIGEGTIALITNSLALLTDAFHMLSDIAAIALALYALRVAGRPATNRLTYGWRRVEILSAAINGATLIIVGLFLGKEAIERLIHPPEVSGLPVVLTALAGVAVNLVATWLLARANRSSLNVEGAYQHILTDLFAFIGTLVAGLVIMATGWTRADAVASIVVCLLMLRSGWRIVRAAGWIFLQAAPAGYQMDEIRDHLLTVPHVIDVHDLHVWTVTDTLPILSAHVVVEEHCFQTGHAADILADVQECLSGHFDIAHSTFQLEPQRMADHGDGAPCGVAAGEARK